MLEQLACNPLDRSIVTSCFIDDQQKPHARLRRHKGDIMSPEKRSEVMGKIKSTNTGPERMMAGAFMSMGWTCDSHARDLPGRPDFVFREAKVIVFVDGNFWHGWRFSQWRDKLSEKWEAKIEANRQIDTRKIRCLRRMGWKVLRLWEHQINKNWGMHLTPVTTFFGLDSALSLVFHATGLARAQTRRVDVEKNICFSSWFECFPEGTREEPSQGCLSFIHWENKLDSPQGLPESSAYPRTRI